MALTLVNAIDQVRYALNETYDNFAELMPNKVDRDFSGASAWANDTGVNDLNSYDETTGGVLTITASAADQFCDLPVASAPTTPGREYRLYYDLSSIVSTWTVKDYTGTQTIGTISSNGTREFIDFTATTPGGLRLVSTSTSSSGVFDNFSLIDLSDGFWSDTEITAWIQEGCRIFSSKSLLVENVGTIDPMILTTPYYDSVDETFLGTALEIYAVIYKISTSYKGLIKIHPRQIGNVAKSATTGPPKYYCLFDRKLYIFPLASAVEVAGGTLDILYAEETDDITALADEYQHLPIMWAVAKAKMKDSKFGEASILMQQFYKELSFERSDKHDREVDTIEDFKIKSRAPRTRQ